MNPIEQLLMAARGHQGLPMQATMGGGPGGPPHGGFPPHGLPPQIGAPPSGGGIPAGPPPPQGDTSDRQVASSAAQHLLEATSQASDPQLKAALTQAAAVLHKYIVGHDKEHQQALTGKLSPRLMAAAHQAA